MKKQILFLCLSFFALWSCDDNNDDDISYGNNTSFVYDDVEYNVNFPPLVFDTSEIVINYLLENGNTNACWDSLYTSGKLYHSSNDVFTNVAYSINSSMGRKYSNITLTYRDDIDNPDQLMREFIRQNFDDPPTIDGYGVKFNYDEDDFKISSSILIDESEAISLGLYYYDSMYYDIGLPDADLTRNNLDEYFSNNYNLACDIDSLSSGGIWKTFNGKTSEYKCVYRINLLLYDNSTFGCEFSFYDYNEESDAFVSYLESLPEYDKEFESLIYENDTVHIVVHNFGLMVILYTGDNCY